MYFEDTFFLYGNVSRLIIGFGLILFPFNVYIYLCYPVLGFLLLANSLIKELNNYDLLLRGTIVITMMTSHFKYICISSMICALSLNLFTKQKLC